MRVKSCCGCSLRTGTLILFWLGLIGGILNVFMYGLFFRSLFEHGGIFPRYMLCTSIIGIVISTAGILGVNKNKPEWLIPYIAYSFLSLIGVFLIMICVLFLSFWIMTSDQFELIRELKVDHTTAKNLKKFIPVWLFILEIFLLINFALGRYFTAVINSYYNQMTESINTPAAIGHSPTAIGYSQMDDTQF